MSNRDRKQYLTATVLDQDFLNQSQDNLTNQLELVVEIETGSGTIYASDRNKYVGDVFYEALLKFPTIRRTLGDWLSPTLEFSTITLELSNADGRFNDLLPGGNNFGGWVQRSVIIRLGLRDVASTYTTIFRGRVTEVGGFARSVKSIKIVARDEFEKLNVQFPTETLTLSEFADMEENYIGRLKPIIYGDWTTAINTDTGASIPGIPVNGFNAGVQAGTTNLRLFISDNDNALFDTSSVVLVRGGKPYPFDVGDVVNVSVGNNSFELKQSGNGGTTIVDEGALYTYKPGDKIFCKVKGKDLGAYDDNIVAIAKDILLTYTGFTPGDFDANWDTFRDKNTPSQSAIANFKARVYRDKGEKAVTYALSLMEQVRLEAYVDRNLKFKLNSLHYEDLQPSPSHKVYNWDVEKDSFKPKWDERNNFNRTQGIYNLLPDINDNFNSTAFLRNDAAITLANGKVISKGVVFPNLYESTVVTDQLREILRMSSSYFEVINVNLTWRALLLDLGDFVNLDVQIGSSVFDDVPCQVRSIGYDPAGIKLPIKFWSYQMTPFPGYEPGYTGTVGVITQA